MSLMTIRVEKKSFTVRTSGFLELTRFPMMIWQKHLQSKFTGFYTFPTTFWRTILIRAPHIHNWLTQIQTFDLFVSFFFAVCFVCHKKSTQDDVLQYGTTFAKEGHREQAAALYLTCPDASTPFRFDCFRHDCTALNLSVIYLRTRWQKINWKRKSSFNFSVRQFWFVLAK